MLKYENLSKPSNKKWKAVADFFLFTLPLYLSAILALPIKESTKLWLNFGITMLTITFKAVSKFTSEES
jgi:predicted phosphoadenosine phosphosulfate sulfurtransferase